MLATNARTEDEGNRGENANFSEGWEAVFVNNPSGNYISESEVAHSTCQTEASEPVNRRSYSYSIYFTSCLFVKHFSMDFFLTAIFVMIWNIMFPASALHHQWNKLSQFLSQDCGKLRKNSVPSCSLRVRLALNLGFFTLSNVFGH